MQKEWRKYDYFEWLAAKVNCRRAEKYTHLLRDLYDIPFHIVLSRDNNRALDGLRLREAYYDDCPLIVDEAAPMIDLRDGECSVLEMMIAMAERFCLDVIGIGFKSTADWFWFMIENMGLDAETDKNYDSDKVRSYIYNMMNRNYKANGEGGMFPLAHTSRDQRKVELWYQFMEWYNERYGA